MFPVTATTIAAAALLVLTALITRWAAPRCYRINRHAYRDAQDAWARHRHTAPTEGGNVR